MTTAVDRSGLTGALCLEATRRGITRDDSSVLAITLYCFEHGLGID